MGLAASLCQRRRSPSQSDAEWAITCARELRSGSRQLASGDEAAVAARLGSILQQVPCDVRSCGNALQALCELVHHGTASGPELEARFRGVDPEGYLLAQIEVLFVQSSSVWLLEKSADFLQMAALYHPRSGGLQRCVAEQGLRLLAARGPRALELSVLACLVAACGHSEFATALASNDLCMPVLEASVNLHPDLTLQLLVQATAYAEAVNVPGQVWMSLALACSSTSELALFFRALASACSRDEQQLDTLRPVFEDMLLLPRQVEGWPTVASSLSSVLQQVRRVVLSLLQRSDSDWHEFLVSSAPGVVTMLREGGLEIGDLSDLFVGMTPRDLQRMPQSLALGAGHECVLCSEVHRRSP
ncbi:unnamed protein product [Polarella glacialis]|uniref:Uncharacterized protein n=1 Tax=Polarella glacialis TaxID=89957 RepID=A0A813K711_POLGL|nr:unnamed protein product [Polarella glacialis]